MTTIEFVRIYWVVITKERGSIVKVVIVKRIGSVRVVVVLGSVA